MSVWISRVVVSCFVLAMGCGPAKRPSSIETTVLPTYTPAESAVFDDEFAEAVFSAVGWSADAGFQDRVRAADSIVVARIKTASEQLAGGHPNIVVELAPSGNPLKGAPSAELVLLTLAPNSPSYRLFRWRQPELLGKHVVLLYRRYTRGDGEEVHFRAEPNINEVHFAIQQALSAAP